MHKTLSFIFGLLIVFYTQSVSASNVNHLVISEVIYGNSNAADEFVEIYNPTNSDINLQDIGLTLHIRNSKGTSDSNKTITWNNTIIPAYGYFLFVSKTSDTYLTQADALYSAALVNNGAVYISYSKSKMTDVIDFISWGTHTLPGGYDSQITSTLASTQSIERMSDNGVINEGEGNNWDTDANDFIVQDSPNPQNSSSTVEIWETITSDTTPPAEVSDLQSISTGSSSVTLQWNNPTDEDFSGLILSYGDQTESLATITSTTIDNLSPATEYTFTLQAQDSSENISTGVNLTVTTLAEPEVTPPDNVSNIQTTEVTDTSITFAWTNPTENFDTIFIQKENEGFIDIGTATSYQFTDLSPELLYTFSFQTKNAEDVFSDQSIFQVKTSATPDTTPPSEVSNIITEGDFTELNLSWENPVDEDYSYTLVSFNGAETQNIEQRSFISFSDLTYNSNYTVQIQTVDNEGNISTGTTEIVSTLNCSPESNTVFINEIAWPGMTALTTDEQALSYGRRYQWIELFNNGTETIDLTGYTITSDEGHSILLDDLNILTSDFLLLQNSESEIFSSEIIPDLYYEDPDSDHRFQGTTTNVQLVDPCGNAVENIPSMLAGDYSTYRPMARKDVTTSPNDESAWFNEKINGSPGEANIVYDTNLSIAYITPDPYYPHPDQSFSIGVDVSNLNDNLIESEYWSIEIIDELDTVIATADGVDLTSYGDFEIIDIEMPAYTEGEYTFTANIICGESCGEYATLDQTVYVQTSAWISEIMVYPDDDESEWIELYNPTDEDIFSGSLICKSNECITIENDILAGEYFVIHETDRDLYNGDWVTFTNTSATISWEQEEWIYNDDYIEGLDDLEDEWLYTTSILDSVSYEDGKKDYSFYRDATTGALTQSSRQTKGLANDYNQIPTAIIEIQNSGNSSGYTPFYFNPDGRSSSDPDGDDLSYSWDFGDGSTSTEDNPSGFYYNSAGEYIVTLTVNDNFGGSHSTEQTLVVSKKSGGGVVSTPKMTEVLFSLSPQEDIFISKVSVNDSLQDWIEISCTNCAQGISLYNYELYDDKSFFRFPNIIITENQPVKVFLVKETVNQEKPYEFFILKKSGLTKTDEQLTLIKDNQIVDALCWNNFDDTQSEKEKKEEFNLKQSKAWKGDCIYSKTLEKKDAVLIREDNTKNTQEAWEIGLPNIKTLEELIEPETEEIEEIQEVKNIPLEGLTLSELMINPKGDDRTNEWIELQNTLSTPLNTEGWILKNATRKYTLPSYEILPQSFLSISIQDSKISLKNEFGEIQLLNPNQELQDRVRYSKTFEEASFAKNEAKKWQWTSMPTKEFKNIITSITKKIIDSDHDGLSDEIEKEIGTDPLKRDTDGDLLPDGFEVKNNLDPLKFNESEEKIFSEYLEQITSKKVHVPKKDQDTLTISGTTEPFALVKLYVHSKPRIFFAKADENGNWSYDLPTLEQGEHTLITQTIDKNGVISPKSEPTTFFLEFEYIKPKILVTEDSNTQEKKGMIKQKNTQITQKEIFQSYTFSKKTDLHQSAPLLQTSIKTAKEEFSSVKYFFYGVIFLLLGLSSFFLAHKRTL